MTETDVIKGVVCYGTMPGSRAEGCGLEPGDVIISVNGIRVTTIGEYLEAVNGQEGGLEIVAIRNKAELVEVTI